MKEDNMGTKKKVSAMLEEFKKSVYLKVTAKL